MLAILFACGGCWEEIRYVPKSAAVQTPVENDERAAQAPEEPAAAAVTEPGRAESAVADPPATMAAAPPDVGDLFISAEAAEGARATPVDTSSEDSILPTPDRLAADLEEPGRDDGEIGDRRGDLAPTGEERRLGWVAASKWSLAAAFHAKGRAALRDANLDEAIAAAAILGIELPPLPTTEQAGDFEASVVEALRGESAVALTNSFVTRFGPAEAAAADLAIRSHLLLLTYSPRGGDAALQAEGLRRAAEGSGLPADLWEPLVWLLVERAPFVAVRQAVFELDDRVVQHLSDAGR